MLLILTAIQSRLVRQVDIDCDPKQIGKAGSPTNVKAVKNIVFKAKESRTLTGSDEDINNLIVELINEKIIG